MSCAQLVRRYFSLTLADAVRKGPKLGTLGEALACTALRDFGFTRLQIDGRPRPKYGALLGQYQGRTYVLEVVTRQKLKRNGRPNRRYRLSFDNAGQLYELADTAEQVCRAKAAWVAVRLDTEELFSAFFGTLLSLGSRSSVPMDERPLVACKELAEEESILKALERGREKIKEFFAFLSYAKEDEGVASELVGQLKKTLGDVWFAPEDARVGFELTQLIREKLATSRFGIPLLTSRYFTSVWSQREFELMLDLRDSGGFDILPVRHQFSAEDARRQLDQRKHKRGLDLVTLDLDELGIESAVASLVQSMATHLEERGETAKMELLNSRTRRQAT